MHCFNTVNTMRCFLLLVAFLAIFSSAGDVECTFALRNNTVFTKTCNATSADQICDVICTSSSSACVTQVKCKADCKTLAYNGGDCFGTPCDEECPTLDCPPDCYIDCPPFVPEWKCHFDPGITVPTIITDCEDECGAPVLSMAKAMTWGLITLVLL